MIYDLRSAINTHLESKGCPYRVAAPTETSAIATWAKQRIVIEENGAETYGAPFSQSGNPKRHFSRVTPFKLTIYAHSAKTGALEFEHRRVARRIADMALVAVKTFVVQGHLRMSDLGGEFTRPEAIAASERDGGAVYELTFSVVSGVRDVTWAGDSADEFTITADNLTSSTEVSRFRGAITDSTNNTVPGDSETASGA